ncbi:MAG TPA: DUF3276 family protein, partial [Tepidisphaeraceae bacterium]|nr:DUF3276 family protein [Tepidisphaeraceae bacterium]
MPAKPTASRVPAKPSAALPATMTSRPAGGAGKGDHKILFQKYFKSISPRNYSVHLKECNNGNHYLVLTETKRDAETGEVKKSKLFIYSEDFSQYFRMLHETAQFIKAHPVAEEIKLKRQRYWAKKEAEQAAAAREAADRHAAAA